MMSFKFKLTGLILFFLVLFPLSVFSSDQPIKVDLKGEKAKVSFLKGQASVVKKGGKKSRHLVTGAILSDGDTVSTGKDTRLELTMPDGSFLRYDENTTFELVSVAFDKKRKARNVAVKMFIGKTWASVTRLFIKRGRFAILTKTAVVGVRGTVYRLNVNKDDSVMVKVYWGEVVVNNSRTGKTETKEPGKLARPVEVSGPHPVAGPHPVSMEEWTYIVKALQQINIRPDGTATKPFRFSIKDDLNDWVQWNKQRDKEINR